MYRPLTLVLVLFAAAFLVPLASSQSVSFTDLIQQLSLNPGDTALRERVVSEGAAQQQPPPIPEEARAAYLQANAMVQAATNSAGQRLAIDRYNAAINLAPWWGDAYFNRGLAQELVGDLDAAKTSFRFYLRSNPSAADVRTTQDRIYAIEGRLALKSAAAAPQPVTQASNTSDNIVVPGERIGLVRLNMSEAQLVSVMGQPKQRTRTPGTSFTQAYGWGWSISVGNVGASIHADQVRAIYTNDASVNAFRTSEGLAMGATEREADEKLGKPCKTYSNAGWTYRTYSSGLSTASNKGRITSFTVWELATAAARCR